MFFPRPGTTYFHSNASMPMMVATNSKLTATKDSNYYRNKRKRPIRTKRQAHNGTNFPDDKSAGPSPDDMYRILLMAAEGYVKLNE